MTHQAHQAAGGGDVELRLVADCAEHEAGDQRAHLRQDTMGSDVWFWF